MKKNGTKSDTKNAPKGPNRERPISGEVAIRALRKARKHGDIVQFPFLEDEEVTKSRAKA